MVDDKSKENRPYQTHSVYIKKWVDDKNNCVTIISCSSPILQYCYFVLFSGITICLSA